MTIIELPQGCERWTIDDPTKNPPSDQSFLEAVVKSGFLAFTHHGGLCGGQSGNRAVVIIHRGGGRKWEVIFQEHDADVVTTMTTNLQQMTNTSISWLQGAALAADVDSVHAVAG